MSNELSFAIATACAKAIAVPKRSNLSAFLLFVIPSFLFVILSEARNLADSDSIYVLSDATTIQLLLCHSLVRLSRCAAMRDFVILFVL
jgi:hypothetical protein